MPGSAAAAESCSENSALTDSCSLSESESLSKIRMQKPIPMAIPMAIPIPIPTGQVGGFHASPGAPEAREGLVRNEA